MDPRVALRLPEDDKEEKRMPEDDAFLSVIAGLIFLSVIAGLGPAIQRYKALAHDMHAESIALQQRFAPQPELRSSWQQFVIAGLIFLSVIAGLGPAIQRYKALAHDMHAESIALQQRFAPQPELRSSWQQFVIAGLIFLSVIAGLGPAIQL